MTENNKNETGIVFNENGSHVVTVNRDPEQYKCVLIEEYIGSLNKLLDW